MPDVFPASIFNRVSDPNIETHDNDAIIQN